MNWILLLAALLPLVRSLSLPELSTSDIEDDKVLSDLADKLATQFEQEYIHFLKTGNETATLKQLSTQLANANSGREIFIRNIAELGTADQFFWCTTCRATANVVARQFRDPDGALNGPNKEHHTKRIILDICQRFNIQTQEVCGAIFDFNWPIVDYIIQNSIADGRSMCGTLPISFCKVTQDEFNWSLDIDANGPAINGPKSEKPIKSVEDLIVLHVTDIHYDMLYQPGTLAECEEIQCCQRNFNETVGTDAAAGYWGDYRVCDSPWHMITNALEHIKATHSKIDYIYNTGDIVDHAIWDTSKTKNNYVLTKVNDLLEQMFPGIPVYSSVGNHEPHPLNVFGPVDVPNEINVKWVYEHLYSLWTKWLPTSTQETILKGGYYTVAPHKGFRIISLNNNDCYIFNWWIYYDGTSVKPQLLWLHDTLLAAEKEGEYVHILAHIPSGDSDCWTVWSREYNRIIERFRNTISGIFNGHTHKDEMNVHYSAKGHHAIGISWNGGSLTTYTNKNPNYRIYEVEPRTMQVVDHETWIFNLTEANIYGEERNPRWYKEYTFSEQFTTDMSPAGIDDLLEKMANSPDLVREYWQYKMTSADPRLEQGCDNKCLLKVICRIATTVYDQKGRCNELRAKLQIALENESTTTTTTTKKPVGGGAINLRSLSLTAMIVTMFFIKFFL